MGCPTVVFVLCHEADGWCLLEPESGDSVIWLPLSQLYYSLTQHLNMLSSDFGIRHWMG